MLIPLRHRVIPFTTRGDGFSLNSGASVFRRRCSLPLYEWFYALNVGYCLAATETPYTLPSGRYAPSPSERDGAIALRTLLPLHSATLQWLVPVPGYSIR